MAASTVSRQRAKIKLARRVYRTLHYAVVTFDPAGILKSEVVENRLTREEADGLAFGFNGACIEAKSTSRAAVVLEEDLPRRIARPLPCARKGMKGGPREMPPHQRWL